MTLDRVIPMWLCRLFCSHQWREIITHDDHNWHKCEKCGKTEDRPYVEFTA